MKTRSVIGVVLVLVVGSSLAQMQRPETAPLRRPELATLWRGMEIPVPAGWEQQPGDPQTAVWSSPERGGSLTLTRTPAGPEPLDAIVRSTARELARVTPGFEVRTVRTGGSRASIEFILRRGPTTIRGQQLWHRTGGHDIITTWTAAPGERLRSSEPSRREP